MGCFIGLVVFVGLMFGLFMIYAIIAGVFEVIECSWEALIEWGEAKWPRAFRRLW